MLDRVGANAAAKPPGDGAGEPCAALMDALGSHIRLEEELLLPALEPRLSPSGPPTARIMREEHRKVLDLLRDAAGGRSARPGAAAEAVAAVRLHLRREEETLFPLARRLLSVTHLERLGASWAAAREFPDRPDQP